MTGEDIKKKDRKQTNTTMEIIHFNTTGWVHHNPNSIRSYKIVQKLSPKHATRGVAQSPYPIYRHGKASLSEQPPWRAAGDPRLARGRSLVSSTGPGGRAARAFFLHPPFLPPSGDSFFRTFPTQPTVRLGLNEICYREVELSIHYVYAGLASNPPRWHAWENTPRV